MRSWPPRARGRAVLGVCGGYQMLGRALHDPDGVESAIPSAPGLGLLPVETTFVRDKTTVRVRARSTGAPGPFERAAGVLAEAYEIHAGVTRLASMPVRPDRSPSSRAEERRSTIATAPPTRRAR